MKQRKNRKAVAVPPLLNPNPTYWDVRSVFSTAAIQEISFSGKCPRLLNMSPQMFRLFNNKAEVLTISVPPLPRIVAGRCGAICIDSTQVFAERKRGGEDKFKMVS
jgi:hypothetical protein